MAYGMLIGQRLGRLSAALCVSAVVTVAVAGMAPALAQDTTQDAGAAAPAAGAAPAADAGKAADGKQASAWVKICDKIPFFAKDKDGKDQKQGDKQICLTQHERFDPNSGALMVSAAIREIEGSEKKALLVGVPLGMVIPPGMAAFIDEEKDPLLMKFDVCLPTGCTAEVEATAEFIDKLSKAKMLTIVSTSVQGEKVGFRVPLNGFADTLAGKPTDTTKFLNARKNLLLSLRERLIAKQKAAQEAAQEAAKGVQEQQGMTGDAAAPADATKSGTNP